jgi:ankyrin repeat protein
MSKLAEFLEAIKSGDRATVARLLDQDAGLMNVKPEQAPSLVLLAMYYSQPGVAELLIERGARLDIFEACACGRLEQVKSLVEQEPGLVNAVGADGFQPLGLACFFEHPKVVVHLLSKGAEVNLASRNPMRVMPLHSAVSRQNLDITRLLLEHDADVNARQADDFTPLHEAAQSGQLEMVQLLLDYGAEVNARKGGGLTPLALAVQYGRKDVADLIKEYGGTD